MDTQWRIMFFSKLMFLWNDTCMTEFFNFFSLHRIQIFYSRTIKIKQADVNCFKSCFVFHFLMSCRLVLLVSSNLPPLPKLNYLRRFPEKLIYQGPDAPPPHKTCFSKKSGALKLFNITPIGSAWILTWSWAINLKKKIFMFFF